MQKGNFGKIEVIKLGFNKFKANWKFLAAVGLISLLVNHDAQLIETTEKYSNLKIDLPFLALSVLWVISWIIKMIVDLGTINISLKIVENKKAVFADLLCYKPLLDYTFASLIYFVIIILGLICLIIPGIIFSIRLQFYSYLIVDLGLGPIEALKKSWEMTKGKVWNLFLLGALLMLLNLAGMLLFLVGLVATTPISMIAMAKVYRKLHSAS